uniref:Uncharacterized protein n=1 Tax=Hucho hucho TaxID=62062 RepID=A0A4W5Q695_9TELE
MSSSQVVQSTKQDLSQNDPQSYQMFIEKQIKQGANNNAPAQPDSCLLEPKKGLLYINACGWKHAPAPGDLTSGPGDQSNKTNNLNQVISSSVTAQPQRPQHQLTVNSDPKDLSEPGADCGTTIMFSHLSISQVRDHSTWSCLRLNEESASATFNKKRILTLQVSIL